jgi:tripartite-type tricarboxylate transporter receptor subunit TctC
MIHLVLARMQQGGRKPCVPNQWETSLKRIFAALAVLGALSIFDHVHAADWPVKPVRVLVSYGAGGAADTMARVFADQLTSTFGQSFYVENRPGGGGLVGTEAAAKSRPDGYTFALAGMSTLVLVPAMNKNAGFDPIRDFSHVAYFGGAPNVFVVHPSFGAKSFKDFMVRAKSGSSIEYVSPGVGSVGNLVAEYLASKENIKLVHVAYRGGAGALLDLVAGHVKVGMMSLSTAGEHIRSGGLIPMAVSSEARLAEFPEVATLKELGYPDLVATTWWALSAPAGLAPDIVDKVNRAINKSLEEPQVIKQLQQDAVQAKAMTPAEVTQFVRSEVDKWVPFVRAAIKTN